MAKRTQVLMISDMIKAAKPGMRKFMIDLGYAQSTARAFADGYCEHIKTLPLMGKLNAVDVQDPDCMRAGFKAAGVAEAAVIKRLQKIKK